MTSVPIEYLQQAPSEPPAVNTPPPPPPQEQVDLVTNSRGAFGDALAALKQPTVQPELPTPAPGQKADVLARADEISNVLFEPAEPAPAEDESPDLPVPDGRWLHPRGRQRHVALAYGEGTNRMLRAETWDQLAADLRASGKKIVPKHDLLPGFLRVIGEDLELQHGDPRAPDPVGAAAFQAAKLDRAVSQGWLEGRPAELWQKMKGADLLAPDEVQELINFTKDFAKLTARIEDPELHISPTQRVVGFTEAPDGLRLSVQHQAFPALQKLSSRQLSERFSRLDLQALVPTAVENIKKLYQASAFLPKGTLRQDLLQALAGRLRVADRADRAFQATLEQFPDLKARDPLLYRALERLSEDPSQLVDVILSGLPRKGEAVGRVVDLVLPERQFPLARDRRTVSSAFGFSPRDPVSAAEAVTAAYRTAAFDLGVPPQILQAVVTSAWRHMRAENPRTVEALRRPVLDVLEGRSQRLSDQIARIPPVPAVVPLDDLVNPASRRSRGGFVFDFNPDMSVDLWAAPTEANAEVARLAHPVGLGRTGSDEVLWLKNFPRPVDGVFEHARRLASSVEPGPGQVDTGMRMFPGVSMDALPSMRPGIQVQVFLPVDETGQPLGLVDLRRRLRASGRGVTVAAEDLSSVMVRTAEGALEPSPRRAVTFTIPTPEALSGVLKHFRGLDHAVYLDGSGQAPEGFQRLVEHHYRDAAGNLLVAQMPEGDFRAPNTTYVWVSDGMRQKLQLPKPTKSAEIVQSGGKVTFGGILRVHGTVPGTTVIPARQRSFALAVPDDDLPVIAYGPNADSDLAAAHPGPIVKGRVRNNTILLELEPERSHDDGPAVIRYDVYDRARSVLEAAGATAPIDLLVRKSALESRPTGEPRTG